MARLFTLTAGTAAVLTALYAAAGYVGVPFVTKTVLENNVAGMLGRDVTVKDVRFDPWQWRFELKGLEIKGRKGRDSTLTLALVRADLSSQMLIAMAPVVEEITVDGLKAKVIMDDEDIRKLTEPAPASTKNTVSAGKSESKTASSGLPAFALYNICVRNTDIRVIDRSAGVDQAATEINFALPFVSTLPGSHESVIKPSFSMKLNGTPITATGSTKLAGQTLEASLRAKISRLDLLPLARLVPALNTPALRFDSGLLSTELSVLFRNPEGKVPGKFFVSGTASVENLKTLQQNGTKTIPLASVKLASVKLTELDLIERRVAVESVVVETPSVTVINPKKRPATANSGAQNPAEPTADDKAWQWDLGLFKLTNGTATLIDQNASPAATVTLKKISAKAEKLSSRPNTGSKASLQATLEQGSVTVSGPFTLTPLTSDITLRVNNLSLANVSPLMTAYTGIGAKNGTVNIAGKLKLKEKNALQWTGDVTLTNFDLTNARGSTLMSWKTASLEGMQVNKAENLTLSVTRAEIDQPGTRETRAVKQIANVADLFAQLANKEKAVKKIQKASSKLDQKIVLENVTYADGRFTANGLDSNLAGQALLGKLGEAVQEKLGITQPAAAQ